MNSTNHIFTAVLYCFFYFLINDDRVIAVYYFHDFTLNDFNDLNEIHIRIHLIVPNDIQYLFQQRFYHSPHSPFYQQ